MVRFVTILLLVLLALRLIGRLIMAIAARSRASRQASTAKRKRLLLAQCNRCGTYFDPGSALATEDREQTPFCSPECRDATEAESSRA